MSCSLYFCVASVGDQTTFNNLRIIHAERDHFDPEKVVWVDRTILAPDPKAPDFTNRKISARANMLGQYVVASLTGSQPPTAQADLAITMIDSPNQVVAGNDLTYTLNVTNNGPQGASGVKLAD